MKKEGRKKERQICCQKHRSLCDREFSAITASRALLAGVCHLCNSERQRGESNETVQSMRHTVRTVLDLLNVLVNRNRHEIIKNAEEGEGQIARHEDIRHHLTGTIEPESKVSVL